MVNGMAVLKVVTMSEYISAVFLLWTYVNPVFLHRFALHSSARVFFLFLPSASARVVEQISWNRLLYLREHPEI